MNQNILRAIPFVIVFVFFGAKAACVQIGFTNKADVIVQEAKKYIGVLEKNKNEGEIVELFQKYVDGKANKGAWCMSFVQFIIGTVGPHEIHKSKHVYTVWTNTSSVYKKAKPSPGYIAVWQRIKDGKLTTGGHTGIVLDVNDKGFRTIEGNVIQKGKEGVFVKDRKMGIQGNLKLLGFLKSW